MRTSLLALLLLGASARAEDRSAFAFQKLIARSVNMGNCLEAPKEGDWGLKVRPEFFALMKQAGFTGVRIPVRWSAHALAAPPYTIAPKFFARVDEVLAQARKAGLAVVLDLHHYDEIHKAPAAHEARFLALWGQVAARYKKAPADVAFELLNEPMDKLDAKAWNALLAKAITEVRKTNPDRVLVVGPASWNSVHNLADLRLPAGDRKIVGTFHYYEPFPFTHQGAEWVGGSKKWLGTKWTGTEKEKAAVRAGFDKASAWAKKEGRPLLLGEFGAYSKADAASRVAWTTFVRSEAERRGFAWSYWEFASGFGIYDPARKRWNVPLTKALLPGTDVE